MRRLARESDFKQVFAIYMRDEVIPFLGYDPMPEESFRSIYLDLLSSGCFFVYEVSGEVAGFYQTSRQTGRAQHVACLNTLALNPSLQGRGIGREMIKDAIAKLSDSGVKRIELQVEIDNPRAIGFYERLGFEYEGTMRRAYKRASDPHFVDVLVL